MSRVDELIAELAPDGVEYLPLASLGKRNKGTAITAARMKVLALEPGPVRVFAGGQTVADVREEAIPAKDIVRVPSIIVKSRGHIGFTYCELPFTHKSELWSYSIDATNVDQKFVYYYLLTQVEKLQAVARATSVKLPQLSVKDTDTLRIPVPPLEIQREIVRILDQFTQLEAELQAELQAELEARRRQYEHYRQEALLPSAGWRSVPLSDLINGASSGRNKSRVDDGAFPVYGSTGQIASTDDPQYSDDALLIARVGANAGRVNVVSGLYDVSDNTLIVTPRDCWDLRFAFHQLTAMNLNQYAVGGGQPLVTGRLLKGLEVATPPLGEQREIASMLDTFDVLINDVSISLSAELAARRKQYEYYRDELVTFKELAA